MVNVFAVAPRHIGFIGIFVAVCRKPLILALGDTLILTLGNSLIIFVLGVPAPFPARLGLRVSISLRLGTFLCVPIFNVLFIFGGGT